MQLHALASAVPAQPGVFTLEGLAFYDLDRLPEASAALASAVAADPQDEEARQMLGLTLFRMGRPADAIPLLETGTVVSGGTSGTGVAGAVNAAAPAAPDTTPAAGQAAGQAKPPAQTKADPSYVLALCYLDTRRYDDARHAFAAQYGFQPDSANAYLLAARMLLRREYLPIAHDSAEKALALDPTLPLAHALLGEIALAGNHLDEAISQFRQEQQRNPLEGSVYDRLGDAYSRQAEYPEAQAALQRAVLLEPQATGPYILLGKVLLKEGDAVGAANYLEHAKGMDPSNFMTHSLLGQAYRTMGRTAEAAREQQAAEQLQARSEPKLATPR